MPLAKLCAWINAHPGVEETPARVLVSGLAVGPARELARLARAAGAEVLIEDLAGNEYQPGELAQALPPLRVLLRKAALIERHGSADAAVYLLACCNLPAQWRAGQAGAVWRVAGLGQPFATQGRLYLPWQGAAPWAPAPPTASPRQWVRDHASGGRVPENLQPWLLAAGQRLNPACPLQRQWAAYARGELALALCSEYHASTDEVLFQGTQGASWRCALSALEGDFEALHACAQWVYEDPQAARVRHQLLAAELARHALGQAPPWPAALANAQLAHQMLVCEVASEVLKALADLRKTVTDEVAKATDASRETATRMAGALAVGIAMLAARASSQAPAWLLIAVMLLTLGYAAVVGLIGWRFIAVQRAQRKHWHTRLYQFLPAEEYQRMVARPLRRAERTLSLTATLCLVLVVLMAEAVVFYSLWPG